MTISRVNALGWGVGEKLTSAQQNGIDTALTYAADKRTSQTDTIECAWTFATTGRLIMPPAAGADANTTYQVTGANRSVRVTSSVTANRNYTLGNTGAAAGDTILIFAEASFTFEITVKNHDGTTIYSVGNVATSEAPWAEFIYNGANWVVFRSPTGVKYRTEEFTSNGTWTCPTGVFRALVIGCGAGGGGANGSAAGGGHTGTDTWNYGGAGGAAALLMQSVVSVSPTTGYAVTLGTGAAATAGGDTTFGALATFAGGGPGENASADTSGFRSYVLGGMPAAPTSAPGRPYATSTSAIISLSLIRVPGQGGYGVTNKVSDTAEGNGARQPHGGFSGGAGGAGGTDSSTHRGGGGGGGGGAGPFGAGGAGGAGGNGNNGGAGTSGTAGTAGGANTGAGGGGGGGAGRGSSAGASSGAGAAGGSGRLIVCWVK